MARTLLEALVVVLVVTTSVHAQDSACEDLRHKAAMLRNGADNCDNAVANGVMSSCQVTVPFALTRVPPLSDSVSATPPWLTSPGVARQAASQLEAVAAQDDGFACRQTGGLGRRPRQASQRQVDATLGELEPFLIFDRTALDRNDPRFKDCPSGCGCPGRVKDDGTIIKDQCTPGCAGTCYQWGGKSTRPQGSGPWSGIDCSGLIAQENPEFWKQTEGRCADGSDSCAHKAPLKCTDLGAANAKCNGGAQRQLQVLINNGLNKIDDASDLRAGDVAYFAPADKNRVTHVVQVVDKPSCTDQGCTVTIIDAHETGEPVQKRTLQLDQDDCIQGSELCFFRGGTPPPGKQTGE